MNGRKDYLAASRLVRGVNKQIEKIRSGEWSMEPLKEETKPEQSQKVNNERNKWESPIVVNGGAILKKQFISFDNVHVSIKNKKIHIDDIESIKVQPWPNSEYEITIDCSDGIVSKRTYIDRLSKDLNFLYEIEKCINEVIYEKHPERRPKELTQKEITNKLIEAYEQDKMLNPPINTGDASVIKRGIVGGVIAGPGGAIVGALSAIDKNNKNRSK